MKNIEIQLNCDAESAVRMIKDQTDPAAGIRILRIMKDPWFWGEIEKNQIKIWPKGPNKDISAAYFTGQINDNDEGSILIGRIVNDPIFRVPAWLIAIAALVGFPAFGYFMYTFMSMGDNFVPALLITTVSIGIVVIGILQRTSESQEEDLEKFLRNVFGQSAILIGIA
jgi:hypothetical protein